MNKNLLIAIVSAALAFLLSSCGSEESEKTFLVTYELCNNSWTGKLMTNSDYVYVDTYKQAVPIMYVWGYSRKVLNVCDFKIAEQAAK